MAARSHSAARPTAISRMDFVKLNRMARAGRYFTSPEGRGRPREARRVRGSRTFHGPSPHPPSRGACHRAGRRPDPLARRRPLPAGEVKKAPRSRQAQHALDHSQYAVEISKDIHIADADHMEAEGFEDTGAFFISGNLRV